MIARYDTPCGDLWIYGTSRAISRMSWEPLDGRVHSGELDWILRALDAYFSRRARIFPGKPSFEGQPAWIRTGPSVPPQTLFHRILSAISHIPFGQTATYGEIAASMGNPRLARVVGQACRNNPLSIVVPCHRIVARGSLGGYTPCLTKKEVLLGHEGVLCPAEKTPSYIIL